MAIDVNDSDLEMVGDITPVINQARIMVKLEKEIAELETQLAEKTAEYNKLTTETLPDLMESVGIKKELSLGNGYKLKLRPIFNASLPAKSTIERATLEEQEILLKRYNDGMAWLRSNKAEDIIKNTLRIDLGKGNDKAAKDFLKLATKYQVHADQSETVHQATLSKFLKEKLAAGAAVPLDTFSVYDGRRAEIEAPKKGKK